MKIRTKESVPFCFERKKSGAFEGSRGLCLRENCVEELLDEGSRAYLGGISLACLAECPHHAGSAIEAGAADKVAFKNINFDDGSAYGGASPVRKQLRSKQSRSAIVVKSNYVLITRNSREPRKAPRMQGIIRAVSRFTFAIKLSRFSKPVALVRALSMQISIIDP